MNKTVRLLSYFIEDRLYGLYLETVAGVVRAAEVTPLPEVPSVIIGAVNVRGEIMPVIDMRRRLGLPTREMELSDHFIIARSSRRSVVLVVDAVSGVLEYPEEKISEAEAVVPGGAGVLKGFLMLEDGMLLIQDLELFLSLEEEARLEAAMKSVDRHPAKEETVE
jgi:purine-binding chemotaxis protein CheW